MIRIMANTYSRESFQYMALALNAALNATTCDCQNVNCADCKKKAVCFDLQSAALYCNKKLAGVVDSVENPVENVEN